MKNSARLMSTCIALALCACFCPASARADANGTWSRLFPTLKSEETLVADPARERCLLIDCGTAPEPGVWAISTVTGERNEIPCSGDGPTGLRPLTAFRDAAKDRFIVLDRNSLAAWSLTPVGVWAPIHVSNAAPGGGGPLSFDTRRSRLLLLGNRTRELWALAFDGNTASWSQLVLGPAGPAARDGAVIAYDDVHDQLLVHGGYIIMPNDGNISFTDIWALSLNSLTWREVSPGQGRTCRPIGWFLDPGAIYWDAARNRMICLRDGCGSQTDVATYSFDDSLWRELPVSGDLVSNFLIEPVWDEPHSRFLIDAVTDSADGVTCYSLAVTNVARWTTFIPQWNVPVPRRSHVATYDATRGTMVAAMGHGIVTPLNDTWELVLDRDPFWRAATVSSPPTARVEASMVSNFPFRNELMFGGDSTQLSGELLSLYLRGRSSWGPFGPVADHPPARERHAAVALGSHATMLIMGGARNPQGNELPEEPIDVWAFDHAWHRIFALSAQPNQRAGHTAIYDPARSRVIVYGGDSSWIARGTPLRGGYGDTWGWSMADSSWTLLSTSGPVRTEHSAVYDAVRDRMLVYGGIDANGTYSNEVWSLSLGDLTWSRLDANGAPPTGRALHTAIYDPVHDRMVVYGGATQNWSWPMRDVWTLDFGGTALPQVEARWLGPATPGGHGEFLAVVTSRMAGRQYYSSQLSLGPNLNTTYISTAPLASGESDTIRFSIPVPDSLRGEMNARFSVSCPGVPYFSTPIIMPLALNTPDAPTAQRLDVWPNPAPGALSVSFTLARPEAATIDLFDIGGRRVASIPLGTLGAGAHSMTLAQTRKISGGIYFLRLTHGNTTETRRVCFVR